MKMVSFISKKRSVKTFYTVIICLFSLTAHGQDLPKVVPPSPEVSALFRFQDYPMDYSTGLPSISIPIYEVKSGSLSVPISISYHASGRRVTDQDGPIALGWSLDAGGVISRTVYGSADFGTPTNGTYNFPYPFRTTGLTNYDDYRYFEKITHFNNPDAFILPWTDSEYDIFSYSFGGNGGKFIFKDNNGVKTPVLLPYKPYIITPYYNSSGTFGTSNYTQRGLTEIDITDDKGVFYRFAQPETAGPDGDYPVTSLSISQMISADKVDTINFVYTGFAQWVSNYDQTRTYKFDWVTNVSNPKQNGDLQNNESPSNGTYQIKRLTEIDFRQGKVLFNLASGTDKVDNIQVKDLNNNIIKTIQLRRSALDHLNQGGATYNPNMTQINNKLDTIAFKDNAGVAIEKYGFEYYPTIYNGSETAINTRYIDWWGYYNASGFNNMIPDYYLSGKDVAGVDHVGGPDWNREPNLEAMKSGVLKKIIYPTGGNSTFTYENNKYSDVPGILKNGPGLRVAQIATTDNNGGGTIKTYKYGIGEAGYGFLELKPDVTTMSEEIDYREVEYSMVSGTGQDYNMVTFHASFNAALSAMAGRPVIYTQVTEYMGTPDNNLGKSVYEYDNYAWAPAGMPAFGPQIVIKKHIYNFNYWNNPSLLVKTDYKNTSPLGGTPAYSIRKKVSNAYNIANIDDVAGLHVQRIQTWPQTGIVGNTQAYYVEQYAALDPDCINGCSPQKIFSFNDYHISVGVKTLANSAEIVYNDDGSAVTNITTYNYNTQFYLSQKIQNTSDGGTITQNITYPIDYTGNAVLTQMVSPSLNMLNFPVEQSELKNTTPISSTRTTYYNFGASFPMLKPQMVETKKGTNAYEPRVQFLGYDSKGNPTSFSKTNNLVNSYIWDYNNSYPVAEVKNANQTDIAYTSFEADGKGNWAYNGTPTADVSAITGGKVYDPSGGSISKTISTAGAYVISYWSKNGAKSIAGTTSISGRSYNGWTYYENTGTFSTGATVSITDAGVIDDLRLYPKDAQMASYTYTPLIGQTSAEDPNGVITYYEYDGYGRLKLVKDLNGNIIKTFKYQYQSNTSF